MRQFMSENSVFYVRNNVRNDEDDDDPYKDDFIRVFKSRERTRVQFDHQSPQIDSRRCLVQYIKNICKDKAQTQSTFHLAVYILDIFMDNHFVVPEQILLLAAVSLLLAAKFEENRSLVPKLAELNEAMGYRYTIVDYVRLEAIVWKFFKFDIMFPTAAHYAYYYIQEAISPNDLKGRNRNYRTLFFEVHKTVTEYLNKIVDDVQLMHCYSPSKLAAAVISISRMMSGLTRWTRQLQNLTEYSLAEITTATISLLK